MKKSRLDLLLNPIFILAVGLLLLNDFYLKYTYGNFLTGKLSDFVGLFLFPYFLSSLSIKRTKTFYYGTAFLFLFWKSEFSQEIINWIRTMGIGVNRVVDYSDLLALSILPFSFGYLQKQLLIEKKISNYLIVPLGILSLFAIWATSLPHEKVVLNLSLNEVYEIQMSKSELLNTIHERYRHDNNQETNVGDSLFYLYFDMVDGSHISVTVLSTITAIDSNKTSISIHRILDGYIMGGLFSGVDSKDVEHFKSISAKEFATQFERNFVKPIENGNVENIYFESKETASKDISNTSFLSELSFQDIILFENKINEVPLPFPKKEMTFDLKSLFGAYKVQKKIGQQDGPNFPLYSVKNNGKDIAFFGMNDMDTLVLDNIYVQATDIKDQYGLKVGDKLALILKNRGKGKIAFDPYHQHLYYYYDNSKISYELTGDFEKSIGMENLENLVIEEADIEDWKIEYLIWR